LLQNSTIYAVSVWVLPVLIAITFHEAAHGFVAHHFGDNTAWDRGRVTFNPFKHIDPFGTLLLPAILLLSHSPFLFGYAKPVPVNFRALRHPRLDMVWVALAGPATNIALALVAATAFHLIGSRFPRWMVAGSRSGCCRTRLRCRCPGWNPMGCLFSSAFSLCFRWSVANSV